MPTLRLAAAAVGLAAAIAAEPASALVLSQEAHFSMGGATSSIDAGGMAIHSSDAALGFAYFDASLGTLTGARWELQSAFGADAEATVWGNGSFATGALLKATVAVQTQGAGGGLLGTGGLFLGGERTESASCSVPTDTWTCSIGIAFSQAVDGTIAATDLAALTGSGMFTQALHAVTRVEAYPDALTGMISSGEYAWSDFVTRADTGTLRLVYEYDPHGAPVVPEPGTATLALLGLAGLLIRRRSTRTP